MCCVSGSGVGASSSTTGALGAVSPLVAAASMRSCLRYCRMMLCQPGIPTVPFRPQSLRTYGPASLCQLEAGFTATVLRALSLGRQSMGITRSSRHWCALPVEDKPSSANTLLSAAGCTSSAANEARFPTSKPMSLPNTCSLLRCEHSRQLLLSTKGAAAVGLSPGRTPPPPRGRRHCNRPGSVWTCPARKARPVPSCAVPWGRA